MLVRNIHEFATSSTFRPFHCHNKGPESLTTGKIILTVSSLFSCRLGLYNSPKGAKAPLISLSSREPRVGPLFSTVLKVHWIFAWPLISEKCTPSPEVASFCALHSLIFPAEETPGVTAVSFKNTNISPLVLCRRNLIFKFSNSQEPRVTGTLRNCRSHYENPSLPERQSNRV
jgi:hypothetical protein